MDYGRNRLGEKETKRKVICTKVGVWVEVNVDMFKVV